MTGSFVSVRVVGGVLPADLLSRVVAARDLPGPPLRELDYGRVPLAPAGGLVADGDASAVSHVWQAVPMHLLGWRVHLDARTKGVAGAAGRPRIRWPKSIRGSRACNPACHWPFSTAKHGEFRTGRLVLEMYDEMVKAIAGGPPYQTRLDPPPGHGPRHLERVEADA